jgi:hypothetical protein
VEGSVGVRCAQPFTTLLSESGQQGRRHRDPKLPPNWRERLKRPVP